MARVCIICEKEPQGNAARVREDPIISTIRSVKGFFHMARNNELYVCENCLPKHREKRKAFERSMVLWVAIGVIVFIAMNALQVISGVFNLFTFVSSVFLALVFAAFGLLNYSPAVDGAGTPESAQEHAQREQEHAGHGHAGEEEWGKKEPAPQPKAAPQKRGNAKAKRK